MIRLPRSCGLLLILGLSLAGGLATAYGTKWGPGGYSDSVAYVYAAKNLLAGRGLGLMTASGGFEPLTLHAPLYSLVLAGLGAVTEDLVTAARWLYVALFAGTIAMVGLFTAQICGSYWPGIVFSAVTLSSPILLRLYTGMFSEPLSISLGLLGLFLLLRFLETSSRRWLVGAALASGLALTARYIAAAYVAAGLIALLVLGRRGWKARLLDILLYASTGAAPMLAWLVWSRVQYHTLASRQFIALAGNVWDALEPFRGALVGIVWSWTPFDLIAPSIPYVQKVAVLSLLILAIAGLVGLALRRLRREARSAPAQVALLRAIAVLAGFAFCYCALLVLSSLFAIPPPDLDQRMFSPLQPAMVIGLVLIGYFLSLAWRPSRLPAVATLAIASLFLGSFLPTSLQTLQEYHRNGRGFTSRAWRESGTIQAVKELPEGVSVITNETAAVLFLTGRPAYGIPEFSRLEPSPEKYRFGDDPSDDIQRLFRRGSAVLVLFDSAFWQLEPMYQDKTETRLKALTEGLTMVADAPDGAIYRYPDSGP